IAAWCCEFTPWERLPKRMGRRTRGRKERKSRGPRRTWHKPLPNQNQRTNPCIFNILQDMPRRAALRENEAARQQGGRRALRLFAECLSTYSEYDNNGAAIGARIYSRHTASCPEVSASTQPRRGSNRP